ncbi:hypothetical protein [Streptomyces sp. IBSBF 2435]|uniref:hypothetical protein n=1 Tax=Streptomyces sp. IBSBF 2435 TaxID=2903531 RepID=UPI002FDC5CBB
MNLADDVVRVAARDLDLDWVGSTFAYESREGVAVYGRIAFIEVKPEKVLVTLDGVLHEGSSVVMTLAPGDTLCFEPA